MDNRLEPLAAIFELNTRMARQCVDGVDEATAAFRSGGGNSMAFILAHLTDSRHYLAGWLGHPIENPLAAALRDAQGIDDAGPLPPLDELRAQWETIAAHLSATLAGAPAELLNESSPQRFPIADDTRLGAIAFLAQHESYHVGQLALLRRQADGAP